MGISWPCCCDNCDACQDGWEDAGVNFNWGTPAQNVWDGASEPVSYFNADTSANDALTCSNGKGTGQQVAAAAGQTDDGDPDGPYAEDNSGFIVDHQFRGVLSLSRKADGSIEATVNLINFGPTSLAYSESWEWTFAWTDNEDCCNLNISLAAADATYSSNYGGNPQEDLAAFILGGSLTITSSC